jgi:hypothetical protein
MTFSPILTLATSWLLSSFSFPSYTTTFAAYGGAKKSNQNHHNPLGLTSDHDLQELAKDAKGQSTPSFCVLGEFLKIVVGGEPQGVVVVLVGLLRTSVGSESGRVGRKRKDRKQPRGGKGQY